MLNASLQEQSQYQPDKTFTEEDLMSDLDPMLEGGLFKVAFYRECPIEIRETDSEGKETGGRSMYGVRIMASPSLESYTEIKIQISSQDNLFMIYETRLNQKIFQKIKKLQNLNFNFQNFLLMLVKQLNLCTKQPEQYSSVLYINRSGMHNFVIMENIEYKSIELLALDFMDIDIELKKQCLSFRFSVLKASNERLDVRTKEMLALVKLKNPNLLQNLSKKATGSSTNLGNSGMMSRVNRSAYR